MAMLKFDDLVGSTPTSQPSGGSSPGYQPYQPPQEPQSAAVQSVADELEKPKTQKQSPLAFLGETVSNILPSAGKAIGDIGTAIAHPIQTAGAVVKTGVGLAEKALGVTPEEAASPTAKALGLDASLDTANAVIEHYKGRYGSLENAANTFKTDPVGFLMDLSSVVSGGAGVVGKASEAAGLTKVAKTAGGVAKAGEAIDPLLAASKGVSKVGGAVAGKVFGVTPDIKAIEAAERTGTELTASGKVKSKFVPVLEAFSEKSLLGGEGMAKRVEQAKSQINEFADGLKSQAGPEGDASTVGIELIKAKDSFHDEWVRMKNDLYSEAKIPKDITFDPVKTKSFVDNILEKRTGAETVIGSASKSNPFADISASLNKANPKLSDFKEAIRQLNENITTSSDPVITGNKATLRKLVATMSDEFDSALKNADPDTYEKLERANTFYKSGIETLDSNIGKIIEAYRGTPSKIIDKIASPATPVEDIDKVTQLLGNEGLLKIRRAVVTDIIDSAKSLASEDGFMTASGIKRGMVKYGDEKLAKILTPEQIGALNDIDTVVKAINKSEKVLGGSQTAYTGKISAIASMMAVNPLTAIGMLVGDTSAARFIASDAGQAMLSTGKINKIPGFEKIPILNGKLNLNQALRMMREGLRSEGAVENDSE